MPKPRRVVVVSSREAGSELFAEGLIEPKCPHCGCETIDYEQVDEVATEGYLVGRKQRKSGEWVDVHDEHSSLLLRRSRTYICDGCGESWIFQDGTDQFFPTKETG